MLAFTAGIVATFNPSRFSQLSAYIGAFVARDEVTQRADRRMTEDEIRVLPWFNSNGGDGLSKTQYRSETVVDVAEQDLRYPTRLLGQH